MYLRANINSRVVASEAKQTVTGDKDRVRLLALARTLNVPYAHVEHLTPDEVSAELVRIQQLRVPPSERGTLKRTKTKRPTKARPTKTKRKRA